MSTAKKEDADVKLCAKALLDMGSKLQEAMAKSKSDSTIANDLEISQLTTVDQWLLGVVEDLLKRQQDALAQGFARVSNVAAEIEASLGKIPGFTDEVAFREAGVKLVSKLAAAAAKLENNIGSLRDSMESVDILCSLRFSDKGPDEDLRKSCDVKSKTDELDAAKKKATRAACVVALVASVCLLRGPELAEASPKASVFAQLLDVHTTLQTKVSKLSEDKKHTDASDADLEAFAEKILQECSTVLAQQKDPKKKRKVSVPGEELGEGEPSKKTEKSVAKAQAKTKQKPQKVVEEEEEEEEAPKPKKDNKQSKGKGKEEKAASGKREKGKEAAKTKRPAPAADEVDGAKKRQTTVLDAMKKK